MTIEREENKLFIIKLKRNVEDLEELN